MIYRETRTLHNLIFYFRLPVVRCFVSWETRLFIFFHSFLVKSKDWTTTYFEQFKSWGIEPIRSAEWKSVQVLRRKLSQFLANQVNLKAEVYCSVPKLAHSQLTCTRQNSCLILFQCYIASYFLCSLDKTYFLVTRVSDYNVCESRDPSRQLLKCHAATTLPFNLLAAAVTKKQVGKNVLPIISA